jgi:acetyltransferase-like isoleucine patch superfamily enzyme
MSKTLYQINIENRSLLRYHIGKLARLKKHLYYSYARYVARKKGATIGDNVVLPLSLAKRANVNLIIGNNSSIQSDSIDIRARVTIGANVIIGSGVEIITCSHEIDSPEWEFKSYGIEIEDYAWIATRVFILPSCRKIARGAVCGAGALVVKDVEVMSVVSGSPATPIKLRKQVHSNLVVESLLGGDFNTYIKTWKNRDRNSV